MNKTTERPPNAYGAKKKASFNGKGMTDAADPGAESLESNVEHDVQESEVRNDRNEHETPSIRRHRQLDNDLTNMTNSELRQKYISEETSHRNMKSRCKNNGYVLNPDFEEFPDFLSVMGPKPDETYTVDRIDPNNPEYSPENARWASKKLQSTNRRNARFLQTSDGTELTLSEWSRRSGIPEGTIRRRIDVLGWPIDDAVNAPTNRPRKRPVPSQGHPRYLVEPYISLWRRILRDTYGQNFYSPTSKEGSMIKNLVMRFDRESLGRPQDIIEFVLENWSDFTTYASEMYGAFSPPAVPTAEFLTKYCNAAGNWYMSVVDEVQLMETDDAALFDERLALSTPVED